MSEKKSSNWFEALEDKIGAKTIIAVFVLLLFWAACSEEAEAGVLEHTTIELDHTSNAGTVRPNTGIDIVQGCYDAPKLTFCLGGAFVSSEFTDGYTFALRERFGDYQVGIGYVSQGTITVDDGQEFYMHENMYVHARRMLTLGKRDQFEMGIGLVYWQNTNRALGANWNFSLSVGYAF